MRRTEIEIAFTVAITIITAINVITAGRARRENNRSEGLILKAHCENVKSETYLKEIEKNRARIEVTEQEIKENMNRESESVWLGDLSGFSIQPDRDSGESGEIWLIHRCGFQMLIGDHERHLANIVKHAMDHRGETRYHESRC